MTDVWREASKNTQIKTVIRPGEGWDLQGYSYPCHMKGVPTTKPGYGTSWGDKNIFCNKRHEKLPM